MALYDEVNGVARKITKMYESVLTDIPIYGDLVLSDTEVQIQNSITLAKYFSRVDDTYYFSGAYQLTSTNKGVANSTARTVLTALEDMQVSFNYAYSSEDRYDKFTLIVGDTIVEDNSSGESYTKSYSGTLLKGQNITLQYSKDGSRDSYDDECEIWYIRVRTYIKSQTGTESANVAREVIKAYDEVDGVAREYFPGGVSWRKWSTAQSVMYYQNTGPGTDSDVTLTVPYSHYIQFSNTYSFSSNYGYSVTDTFLIGGQAGLSSIDFSVSGVYYASGNRLVKVNYLQTFSDDGSNYVITYNVTTYYPSMYIAYSKGTVDYGVIIVPAGELPEIGFLNSGSATSRYCVLQVNGTYYYYERV